MGGNKSFALLMTFTWLISPTICKAEDKKFEQTVRDFMLNRIQADHKWSDKTSISIENAKGSAIDAAKHLPIIADSMKSLGLKPEPLKFQYFLAESGSLFKFHQPGFANGTVLEYDVDPTISASAKFGAGVFAGRPLIYWQRTWSNEGRLSQRETMSAQTRKTPSAFQSLEYGLELENAAKFWLGDRYPIQKYGWLYVLTSPQVEHQHSEFYGSATSNNMIALIREGSAIQGGVVSGNITALNTNEELGFKTRFDTWRVSLNAFAGIPELPSDSWLKLSYFHLDYQRPTPEWQRGIRYFSCTSCGPNRRQLVFDADYESQGIGVDLQWGVPLNDNWRGIVGINYDFGIKNSITLHDSSISLYDKSLHYTGAGIRLGAIYHNIFDRLKALGSDGLAVDAQIMGTASLSSWSTDFVSVVDQDYQESLMMSFTAKF